MLDMTHNVCYAWFMNAYIYGLSEHTDGIIRYVGKADCVHARYMEHARLAYRAYAEYKKYGKYSNLHTPVYKWMADVKRMAGTLPCYTVLDVVDYEQWATAEKRWIAELNERGNNLVNIVSGGNGSTKPRSKRTEDRTLAVLNGDGGSAETGSVSRYKLRGKPKLSYSYADTESMGESGIVRVELPELFGIDQVAEYMRVSTTTVYTLLQSGKLHGTKIGRSWRVTKEAIVEYLAANSEDEHSGQE